MVTPSSEMILLIILFSRLTLICGVTRYTFQEATEIVVY